MSEREIPAPILERLAPYLEALVRIIAAGLALLILVQGVLSLTSAGSGKGYLWAGVWLGTGLSGAVAAWVQRRRAMELSLAAQSALAGWVALTLRVPSIWAIVCALALAALIVLRRPGA